MTETNWSDQGSIEEAIKASGVTRGVTSFPGVLRVTTPLCQLARDYSPYSSLRGGEWFELTVELRFSDYGCTASFMGEIHSNNRRGCVAAGQCNSDLAKAKTHRNLSTRILNLWEAHHLKQVSPGEVEGIVKTVIEVAKANADTKMGLVY